MGARHLTKEFFLNERLAEVSTIGRLFFMGLCALADREGRLEDRPRRLKKELLPYDEADGEALLAELSAHGLLSRYTADGRFYLAITGWRQWQKPSYREAASAIPAPIAQSSEAHCPMPDDSLANDDCGIEQSCAQHWPIGPQSLRNELSTGEKPGGADDSAVMHSAAAENRTKNSITPVVVKEIEQEKKKNSSSEIVRYGPEHRALAERLREKILANKADARVPADLARWADVLRLMTERDKRKPERIAAVIDWATKDPFWSGNILSADSLRRHFDRLELAMQREGKAVVGEDAISRAAARLERMGL